MPNEPELTHEQLVEQVLEIESRLRAVLQEGPASGWLQIDLTLPQLKTLLLLGKAGTLHLGGLSEQLEVGLSTASGIVDRLHERGMLIREADPADRRSVRLSLSEQGRLELSKLYSIGRNQFEHLIRHVEPADLQIVARALAVLHQAALALDAERTAAPAADSSHDRDHSG
jgi:DNA-binding MarR family transcriptional regulator